MHRFTFEAIGTSWSIETSQPLAPKVQSRIERTIESFDSVYSRFRDDSVVRRIASEGTGSYEFPESIKSIYEFYEALYEATEGKVTPLIGGSLESLGYDKDYSLQSIGFSAAPMLHDAVSLHGTNLEVKQQVVIDIGAAGKGYLVDRISEILKAAKVDSFVVDASGDMYIHNATERVGLENPYDSSKVLGVATVQNQALCASATNRRRWGDDLHHVLDPTTGRPVSGVMATWVVADTTMHADGIATALFFAAPSALESVCEFSYALLRDDGTMQYSKDSTCEVFE